MLHPDMAAPIPRVHNFDEINAQILQPGCALSASCHTDRGKTAAKFSMCGKPDDSGNDPPLCKPTASADDAYAALIRVAAQNTKAMNMDLALVDPCHPDTSFMIIKLELAADLDDPLVGYGAHMPKSNDPLPKQTIQDIRDWISRGALRHEPDMASGSTPNNDACM
jgi:hypothetical protein